MPKNIKNIKNFIKNKREKEGREEGRKDGKKERRSKGKEKNEEKKLLQILNFLKVYNIKQNKKKCLKVSCKLSILRGQIGF